MLLYHLGSTTHKAISLNVTPPPFLLLLMTIYVYIVIAICCNFSQNEIQTLAALLQRKRKKKLIRFVMTFCSVSATLEMPQLILYCQILSSTSFAANKASPFCMCACLNCSCCIIYGLYFEAGECEAKNCGLLRFKETGDKR